MDRIVAAAATPVRRPDAIRLETVDSLDGLADEWRELAARTGNIFATWEWHRLWWKHFAGGRPLSVTTCRTSDGRLRAIVPLYLWSRQPLKVLRFLGHSAGDELGPIYAPGDRALAVRALRESLRMLPWDVLIGEQLPADAAWASRLSATTLVREGYPVVRFESRSWDELMQSWSRRLRKELHQDERRLHRQHDVRFRLVTDPDRLGHDLETLFSLHGARWGRSTRFSTRQAFHHEFAAVALERGWLRLRVMEIDRHPAAARYGFRFNGIESGYQSGRDPRFARDSIGLLLVAETVHAAVNDGMREYRFLRGGEQYKYRFANADPGLETIGLGRGPTGTAALSAAPALRSARAALEVLPGF